MDTFKEMNVIRQPDGKEFSIEEYSKMFFNGVPIKVLKNDTYQVVTRVLETVDDSPNLVHLSIKRIDKEAIHDWRELQEIKNQLVGAECEGVELYPAESRRVDTANQYHLWVWDSKDFRIGFGFQERLVTGEDVADNVGAKQRPFNKGSK